MVSVDEALPGRDKALVIDEFHFVNGQPLKGPYPEGAEKVLFGLGCFWGAERLFWQIDGVWVTAVGYGGGITPNPTYEEVCTGLTGHNELVMVVFDPIRVEFENLMKVFWQSHDPTQGMRQGNDIGTQYRSGVYLYSDEHFKVASEMKHRYETALMQQGFSPITTEVLKAESFYFAESYHQQYLAKNPAGYCGLAGLDVCYPHEK